MVGTSVRSAFEKKPAIRVYTVYASSRRRSGFLNITHCCSCQADVNYPANNHDTVQTWLESAHSDNASAPVFVLKRTNAVRRIA